jgi:hypothetical protein
LVSICGDFERITAGSITFAGSGLPDHWSLKSISRRRASHAFVEKLIEERAAIDVLHEWCWHCPKRWWKPEVWTPLVALTDPKVSTTLSSNRFTFTLTASGYRVTLPLLARSID